MKLWSSSLTFLLVVVAELANAQLSVWYPPHHDPCSAQTTAFNLFTADVYYQAPIPPYLIAQPGTYSTSLENCATANFCGTKHYYILKETYSVDNSPLGNMATQAGIPCHFWEDTFASCEDTGGRLAIVRDAYDDWLVRRHIGLTKGFVTTDRLRLWLGAARVDENSPFYWIDGTPVTPASGTPWLPGFPTTTPGDNYMVLQLDTTDLGGQVGWMNTAQYMPSASAEYYNAGLCECPDVCADA